MLWPNVFADHESLSRYAADWLANRLNELPTALFCLAAGGTPGRTYALLAERGPTEPALFEKCRIVKLDEWGGLAMNDRATCEQQLQNSLIGQLNLSARYIAFNSRPDDPEAECRRIAAWLDEHGPIDTCVLGLGMNGHVGFNEPADFLQPHAHVAQLAEASLAHPMIANSGARPSYGLTLGMADLLQSHDVLLLVTGAAKRGPLKQLLSGRITTQFPASLLHTHPRVQLLCDAAAWPH